MTVPLEIEEALQDELAKMRARRRETKTAQIGAPHARNRRVIFEKDHIDAEGRTHCYSFHTTKGWRMVRMAEMYERMDFGFSVEE